MSGAERDRGVDGSGRDTREGTDDELAFHVEMRVRDYVQAGMSEAEARRAAHARMGDLETVRHACDKIDAATQRARRRRAWVAEAMQDLRFAARSLRRAPTFAAMAVLTLTVGIGATTAIFSMVHAVLLAPLPYPEPERLVRVWETSPQGSTRNVVSPGNVRDWQERAGSFDVLAALSGPFGLTLTGEGHAERVTSANVEPGVIRALGVAPALGAPFADGAQGDEILLSHAFWMSHFGGDAAVLGRRLTLDDVPRTVVGVMPPGFAFPEQGIDVWGVIARGDLDPSERTSHNYAVVARLAPDVSVSDARAEMGRVVQGITEEHPASMTGWGANVVPLHADLTGDVQTLFRVLMGGVAVVLLIVCASVANLLLARALAREREMALRGALGAGHGRLVRQMLTESGLLAALGGAGALLLAPLLLRVLVGAAPAGIPFIENARIDARMLGFTAAAALGCAVLFGLFPALRGSAAARANHLRGGRGVGASGHAGVRSGLLVAQVGLSVVLLIGAGLFVRSFRALEATELGFDPQGLLVVPLDVPGARYEETAQQSAFYEAVLREVAALPGVAGVATTSAPPGDPAQMTFSFAIEGRTATNASGREDDEPLAAVTPGYFELLGQRMVDGRAFDARDGPDGAPAVIINESLARKHWPEGDAVGQRMAFRVHETPWREIVGVVADARVESPDVAPRERIYIPFAQKRWSWLTWSALVIRARGGTDPLSLVAGVRQALQRIDPNIPIRATRTVDDAFRANTADRRFAMTLVSGFGLLALLLSVVGLYGLITYSVEQERREIGVRIALGARSGEVVRAVLRRSVGLAALGAAGGVAGALVLGRALESLLYGVTPVDATTYAVTVAVVLGVATLTAALPAARAARTDPARVLGTD